jgi:SsrA-binding protein
MVKSPADENNRRISENRRAKFEYELLDTLECGIALKGSEVKTLRGGKVALEDAFARVQQGELWLINCEIPHYPQAAHLNHEPRRERKLLIHKRERDKFVAKANQSGFTLIPLSIYFKNGLVKVSIAVGKGKKTHDKRETLKKQDAEREIRKALAPKRG